MFCVELRKRVKAIDMKKYSVIAALCGVLVSSASIAQTRVEASHPKYQSCRALAVEVPQEAVTFAEAWIKKERTATSLHCHSIALYKAKKFSESARKLMEIHTLTPRVDVTLRASLKRQAARAWMLAGESDTALRHLSGAIKDIVYSDSNHPNIKRVSAELLLERADVYHVTEELLKAVQDLDHAETFGVLREQILEKRAKTYILMENKELALKDIGDILKTSPHHQGANMLLAIIGE